MQKESEGPISHEKPGEIIEVESEAMISILRELPGSPAIAPVGKLMSASGNLTPPAEGEGLWF